MFIKSLFLLTVAVVFVATASIGLEAYNADPKLREGKPINYNFLVVGVGLGVITAVLSLYWAFQAWRMPSLTAYPTYGAY